MNTSKIIKGVVNSGRYTVTAPIVKEDYGLYLQIEGVELPSTYEVDFSNSEHSGTSVTMIGNSDGVLIPHQFIDTGKDIFAFLYHVGADYGRTVYKFRIPNKLRPDRTSEEPTPEEQSVIDQTISALNEAVEQTQDAQQAIEDMSVSATTLAEGSSATVTKTESDGVVHLEFGIPRGATGVKGDKGDTGESGKDALSVEITNPRMTIPVGSDGYTTKQVYIKPIISAYKGSTKVDYKIVTAGEVTVLSRNGNYWGIPAEISTGKNNPPEWTIPADKRFRSNTGELSITVTVEGQTVNLSYGYTVLSDGAKGEKGDKGDTGATGAQGIQGAKGDTGADGISPTVTITPITGGHRITITDADGSHFADVMDGDDYTLTAQDKQDIAELVDVPVEDVQVNGTSIVNGGVANVPIAGSQQLGAVRVDSDYGIAINSSGRINVATSTEDVVKGGVNQYKPITPKFQHNATFYGLAKAAGDTTQSQSSNAVGVYTEDAKSAIQDMIGIDGWKLVAEETLAEEGYFDITIANSAREVYIYAKIEIASGATSLVAEAYNDSGTRVYYQTFGGQISATKKAITVLQLIPIATEIKALVYLGEDVFTNSGHFDWQHKSFNVGKLNRFKITAYGGTTQIPTGSTVRIFAR